MGVVSPFQTFYSLRFSLFARLDEKSIIFVQQSLQLKSVGVLDDHSPFLFSVLTTARFARSITRRKEAAARAKACVCLERVCC